MRQIGVVLATASALLMGVIQTAHTSSQIPQVPLPGTSIPKFVDPLPHFAGARVGAPAITVTMDEIQQKILPASVYATLPAPYNAGTYVWAYNVGGTGNIYPGRTIEAKKDVPTEVTYINQLETAGGAPPLLQQYLTVDQTLHWAAPNRLQCMLYDMGDPGCMVPYAGSVPTAAHLHGGEVPSAFDGGPDAWMTADGRTGAGHISARPGPLNQVIYTYPNGQEAAPLWFHDHALGVTRLNVYAGLAGFYLMRDNRDNGLLTNPIKLPAGPREIELAIQDRMFDTNGQLLFPDAGINPEHPFWVPEFVGDVMVVNGKSWPFLNVEPRRYRFRILDGCNARFLNLALITTTNTAGPPIWVIGSDGGLLDKPVKYAYPARLLMAPGERYDIIIDFTPFKGKTLTLVNNAPTPYPFGAPITPDMTQVMQFRVGTTVTSVDTTCNPAVVNSCNLRGTAPIIRLTNPTTGTLAPGVVIHKKRQLTLTEVMGPGGPLEMLINNTTFSGLKESSIAAGATPGSLFLPEPIADSESFYSSWNTENPRVGSTELWEIINLTADAHPMHLHLIQLQVMNRQAANTVAYGFAWNSEAAITGIGMGDGPPLPYNTLNADGAVGGNPAFRPYLSGAIKLPRPNEIGWKDTVIMNPGEVTRIIARFAPQDTPVTGVTPGVNLFPFDPTAGLGAKDQFGYPGGWGYVWHCHIIDHEDNEMMRPMRIDG